MLWWISWHTARWWYWQANILFISSATRRRSLIFMIFIYEWADGDSQRGTFAGRVVWCCGELEFDGARAGHHPFYSIYEREEEALISSMNEKKATFGKVNL
jgi:hypothetical protein